MIIFYCILEPPQKNEDVRVVKETGLRSVGASLVGSTPTPRKEFGWFSQNLHFAEERLSNMV